jgi:hypothetical protein
VKEWWAGSISFFKRVDKTASDICFTLSGGGLLVPDKKCHDFADAQPYVYTWEGLSPGDDYRLEETGSGPFVPNPPITDITVDDANRDVLVRTLQNLLPGDEGCTPGYWKNHLDMWEVLKPDSGFNETFDVTPEISGFTDAFTLLDAINKGGGGVNKLARHGVAGALSASSSGVRYPFSYGEVLNLVQSGLAGDEPDGEPEATWLAGANELGCSLK